MNIDVSKIVKAEGASQEVSLDIDFDRLSFNGQDFLFVSPMKVEGIIKNAGGNLYLDATVRTRFTTACARCLKEITEEFDFDISERDSAGSKRTIGGIEKCLEHQITHIMISEKNLFCSGWMRWNSMMMWQ